MLELRKVGEMWEPGLAWDQAGPEQAIKLTGAAGRLRTEEDKNEGGK